MLSKFTPLQSLTFCKKMQKKTLAKTIMSVKVIDRYYMAGSPRPARPHRAGEEGTGWEVRPQVISRWDSWRRPARRWRFAHAGDRMDCGAEGSSGIRSRQAVNRMSYTVSFAVCRSRPLGFLSAISQNSTLPSGIAGSAKTRPITACGWIQALNRRKGRA